MMDNTITVSINFDKLTRIIQQAEYIDASEIIRRARQGADWVHSFRVDSLARHIWKSLYEMTDDPAWSRAAELERRFPLVPMETTGIDWHSIQVIEEAQRTSDLRRGVEELLNCNVLSSDRHHRLAIEQIIHHWVEMLHNG